MPDKKTLAAILITFGAAVYIFYDSIQLGNFIGDLFGLITALGLAIGAVIDYLCFSKIRKGKINHPILIVGNPRSGTTFLHHYLTSHRLGTGSQLWQMLYPSVVLQKIIRPFLPFLEKVSPTHHHSTAAHKTSLQSFEKDDASILFRYLDGFFL